MRRLDSARFHTRFDVTFDRSFSTAAESQSWSTSQQTGRVVITVAELARSRYVKHTLPGRFAPLSRTRAHGWLVIIISQRVHGDPVIPDAAFFRGAGRKAGKK